MFGKGPFNYCDCCLFYWVLMAGFVIVNFFLFGFFGLGEEFWILVWFGELFMI